MDVNLVCAHKHLQTKADTDTMRSKMDTYLGNAIAKAAETPSDGHPVKEWFGALSDVQLGTLRTNLTELRSFLQKCDTTKKTSEVGTIRLVPGALNARYGNQYFAQVRGLGWVNALRPTVSVEVGTYHLSSSYGEKVATVFHELTHRIVGTIDVKHNGVVQYGTSNCRTLAGSNPELAITNADSYGYFIGWCTKALKDVITES